MKKMCAQLMLLACCTESTAQELTLFEELEVENRSSPVREAPDQPVAQTVGSPAFKLRGTSRFGDEFKAVLEHRDGSAVQVEWHQGLQGEVPGYSGYAVSSIGNGSLTLQQPAGERCVASEQVGVSCSGANTAVLALVNGSPLEVNGTPPVMGPQREDGLRSSQSSQAQGQNTPAGAEGDDAMLDPFAAVAEQGRQLSEDEQAARVERARLRQERLSQFEPVRISDEDVPPGMRVVRTPFGDRLVPVR